MENPASWTLAEWVVLNAYDEWHRMTASGAVGLSIARCITDALREHGCLAENSNTQFPLNTFRSPL